MYMYVSGVVEAWCINHLLCVKPLTPMSDQERIFPSDFNTISNRQEMRIKKKQSIRGLLVDPILNSPN